MRMFNPATDLEALAAIEQACHPTRTPRTPLWWQIIPTVVEEEPGGATLSGYTQFSLAPDTLYLYDTAVHPDFQRMGLARRFMAERLLLGQRMGCRRAIGYSAVGNTPMRMLLAQAKFIPGEIEHGYYQELTPPQDAVRYMSTEASFEWAKALLIPDPVEV